TQRFGSHNDIPGDPFFHRNPGNGCSDARNGRVAIGPLLEGFQTAIEGRFHVWISGFGGSPGGNRPGQRQIPSETFYSPIHPDGSHQRDFRLKFSRFSGTASRKDPQKDREWAWRRAIAASGAGPGRRESLPEHGAIGTSHGPHPAI